MSEPSGAEPRRRARVVIDVSGRAVATVLLVVGALWLVARLPNLTLMLVLAVLLSAAIDQPVTALQARGVPRPFGILLCYLVGALTAVLVAAVIVPLVRDELEALREELPERVASVQVLLDRAVPGLARTLSTDRITSELTARAGIAAERLTAVTIGVARTLFYAFVTVVLGFFLASEPDGIDRLLRRFLRPATYARIAPAEANARRRIGAWARGQVLIALTFGTAMGLGLKLIGVPYAISLGVVAAALEVIPYVGGAITVVLAVVTAFTVGWPQVVAVVVLYVVLVNLESHVLEPLFFGRAVGLPPILILVSLLAGVELVGILGALIAVPAAVIVTELVDAFVPRPPAAADGPGGAAPSG